MSELYTPQSRYILPSFVERTSYGIKEMNPYNKMFEERIIFLGVQIDDASANDVMAQLLTLESIDPDRDIGDLRHDAVRAARHPDGLPGPGGVRGRGAAVGRHPRQADGTAQLADHHPPAGHRGRLRTGLRHRDPGARNTAYAHPPGGAAGPAFGPEHREGPQGHRP